MPNYRSFITALLICITTLFSCKKESTPADPAGTVDDNLHMAFTTPDWSKHIDCTLLNLNGITINDSTRRTSATSQSTKESFYFSYPKDSSSIVRASNIKRYGITMYADNKAPFEFAQILPITEGATNYLRSEAGFSDNSYNEVTEIKYVGSETNAALFQVKCRYKMITAEENNTSNKKTVTGTFHLKIRTTKN